MKMHELKNSNGKTTNATEAEGLSYRFKGTKLVGYLKFFLDLLPAICLFINY